MGVKETLVWFRGGSVFSRERLNTNRVLKLFFLGPVKSSGHNMGELRSHRLETQLASIACLWSNRLLCCLRPLVILCLTF